MRRTATIGMGVLLALLLFASPPAGAQQKPNGKEVFTPEEQKRAAQIEDAVAGELQRLRKSNGLRTLTRSSATTKSRQILCSVSVNGTNANALDTPFRWTAVTQPEINSKLVRMAVAIAKNKDCFGCIDRLMVTAYPARTANFPAGSYWVQVDFLMGPFAEWFNDTFTDERHYRDLWKKQIAPQCRDIQ